jgi:hypothetical protein
MWWALRNWMTASMDEAAVVLPVNLDQMLANWVHEIRRIDGWDFLERALETWEMVTSMLMVMAGMGIGRGEEVYGDIEGAAAGMIWDSLGGFTLDIMFGLG